MSTPSMRTAPLNTSTILKRATIMLLFPAPVRPQMPTLIPPSMRTVSPLRTGSRPSLYLIHTPLNSIPPTLGHSVVESKLSCDPSKPRALSPVFVLPRSLRLLELPRRSPILPAAPLPVFQLEISWGSDVYSKVRSTEVKNACRSIDIWTHLMSQHVKAKNGKKQRVQRVCRILLKQCRQLKRIHHGETCVGHIDRASGFHES